MHDIDKSAIFSVTKCIGQELDQEDTATFSFRAVALRKESLTSNFYVMVISIHFIEFLELSYFPLIVRF